jgi:anti-sigma B factor antagonist
MERSIPNRAFRAPVLGSLKREVCLQAVVHRDPLEAHPGSPSDAWKAVRKMEGRPLLQIERDNGEFRLVGEIDMSNAAEFTRTVTDGVIEGGEIVFDCSDLKFIDSTGMAALVEISRGLGENGRLVLRSPRTSLVKAVHVLGLDRLPNLELATG